MNIWRLVPAAILVCAATSVQADTITVLNPSFEDQVFSTGTGTTYPYGTITDWTATTASLDGFNGNVSDRSKRRHWRSGPRPWMQRLKHHPGGGWDGP
jgi:hypothetical protein